MRKRVHSLSAWITIAVALAAALSVMLRAHLLWEAEFFEAIQREDSADAASEERALVEIDFGDGRRRMFEGSAPVFFHPLDFALTSAAEAGRFSVTVRDGRIAELAGINGALGGRWRVYRGQEQIRDPVDRVIIRNGEHYVIRYEK